jgi:hypothetical protein
MLMYVQEPVEIERRGSMGRRLNGKKVSSGQDASSPLRKLVAYKRDVSDGVPATVIH